MGEATQIYETETFNIHGMRLAVAADAEWVRDGVRDGLRAFKAETTGTDAAMLLMAGRDGAVEAPRSVEEPVAPSRYREGLARAVGGRPSAVQFRFGGMQCLRAADRLVYTDGASTIIVDPTRAHAEGTVCRTAEARDGGLWHAWGEPVFTFSLLELLRCHGLYHLHAAAVEREGAGVLIAGDTGSGKSTLTVLLARAGWGFLSDDAVLLRLTETGVEARALPAPFHLDPALAAYLPELQPLADASAYNGGAKRLFRPELAYGRDYRPSVPPRLILLPRVHRGGDPPAAAAVVPGVWLRRLSAGQAVAELIRASALVLLDERAAAGHLESLRRLATSCPAYRLIHGPEALQAPGELAALVQDLLAVAGTGVSCQAGEASGVSPDKEPTRRDYAAFAFVLSN